MAGMRAVHKKNGTTFKYSGDLKETIEKAEKELKEKEGTNITRHYMTKQGTALQFRYSRAYSEKSF